MANETEVIREKMEATRTDLSNKIEKLENQVVNTVQEASSTVSEAVHDTKEVVENVTDTVEGAVQSVKDTVENVTGMVGDAVDSVKETFQNASDSVKETFHNAAESIRQTFDLPAQVDRHPWLMVGGAVAVGFVAGKLLDHAPEAMEAVQRALPSGGRLAESAASAAGTAASAAGGLMTTLERMFGPEMTKVKELAIGALLGVIRDVAVQAAPPTIAGQVREIIDGFTSKLGGKPVEGSVLGPRPSEEEAPNGPGRRF